MTRNESLFCDPNRCDDDDECTIGMNKLHELQKSNENYGNIVDMCKSCETPDGGI